MKFGDEQDFKTAITELKWLEKEFGKLHDNDFNRIAIKYHFLLTF
jgi:hypothetical protein